MLTILNPHPDLLLIGGFTVTAHGVFFALAGFCAMLYVVLQAHLWGWRQARAAEMGLWVFAAGLLGARAAYLFWYREEFTNVWQLLAIWQGGLISFGGIVVGALVVLGYVRKLHGERRQAFLRTTAIAMLIGWGVGRFGNYYAIETVGVLNDFWAATYGRVPIQLFEALLCLTTAWAVHRYWKQVDGRIVLGLYFIIRFLVDFWRDEPMFLLLRHSQVAALIGLVVIAVSYARRR